MLDNTTDIITTFKCLDCGDYHQVSATALAHSIMDDYTLSTLFHTANNQDVLQFGAINDALL